MTCTRCQGCMAKDYFIDLMESAESMWMAGWRCLNCGNVLDPVVEKNRRGDGTAVAVSTARVSAPDWIVAQEEVDVIEDLAA
jgi:uncharacterized Zn finger protein